MSSYEIIFPIWKGNNKIIRPFEDWKNGDTLSWYKTYNDTKHDRHVNFESATFESLLQSICGLLVILSSQFYTWDLIPGAGHLLLEGPDFGIGDYFEIKFPNDWSAEEKYAFSYEDWKRLKTLPNPFQKHSY